MNVTRPGTPDNMIQYQCTASNGVGKHATATVNVTVHCKYFNKLIISYDDTLKKFVYFTVVFMFH